MSSRANPKVYMDIQIGAQGAGRVIFQLFCDLTPKTVQNFRGLCTGQYGKAGNAKLHYLNTKFHRIVDGFVVQGGDITHGGGNGGYSIYGRSFTDENFSRTHSCAGLLSMANCGRNTNSSQFFITLKACPHLDQKHVVFGQVIDGMEVVKKMSKVAIDMKDKPKIPIIIIDCGEVGDFKAFIKYDPFKKENWDEIKRKKRQLIDDRRRMIRLLDNGMATDQAYEMKKRIENSEKQISSLGRKQQAEEARLQEIGEQPEGEEKEHEILQEPEPVVQEDLREKIGEKNANRLLDLKLRINEAKMANSKAALQEQIRESDVNYHKKVKKQEWLQKRKHAEQQLIAKGLSSDKLYLNKNALRKDKEDKPSQSFGWNVFGEDAFYKAYDKRCDSLQIDTELYKKQMSEKDFSYKPSDDKTEKLSNSIIKQIEKRSSFSRRKMYDEDETVTYINERNRVFNKKIERSYGTYSSASKTSLEMNSQK